MFEFEINPEMVDLLARVRDFMEREVHPLEKLMLGRAFSDATSELEAVRERVRAAGLFAPQVPREYGGLGLGFRQHGLVSEVLGRSPLGHYVFNCQAPDAGNMEILHLFGTPEQKQRFLRPLTAGEIRSCFSMTEPERAGSNPTWLETRAVRDGDSYVIDGHKWFTSSADGAAFAVVMAVTNADAPPYARASMILVPTDTPGFEHVRRISVMGHEGSGWASHSEIRYRGCRVPTTNRLGDEGAGFMIAQERLGPGRIHHCMRWMGICERAFEMMCRYAATREVSPGKPLGTKQMIQDFVAESRAEIDAAKLLIQHAAWKIDKLGQYEARNEVSAIKFYAANVLGRVLDRAIQTHGGLGVTDDTPLASWWLHERAARIYDGPDEVHKAALARRILKAHGLVIKSDS
ncbi:MAG: acyl-CoA dehydrogenase family protein [Myxococcales bacterium]|nr:acyl-CoA dehydrogenase family protein [Myxococcales bacterium]